MDTNDTQYLQHTSNWVSYNDDNRYAKSFIITFPNCEYSFLCGNRATRSQLLPMSALQNYPTLQTVSQVAGAMMSRPHYKQKQAWWKSFQNVYIVQILSATNQIEVSKVEIADKRMWED